MTAHQGRKEKEKMKYTEAEQREVIERAIKMNTYVCGADSEVCGLPREALPFPCQTCKRNKHWKERDNEY